jgi:hypothetical protein
MYQTSGEVLAPAVVGATTATTGALAMTGFAFGLYIALALVLIVAGVLLRWAATAKAQA